ncbi:gamma subclass chorismate mutase AroQ [Streptomyces xiaopingdaonensis]|uniref:gamma subclass chorismate mutase AroQ n=1 Tax=Streptomyces xiaopingdaonensis TaxID=1565415 RepID=UPI000381FA5B|nr:gamma subclass chorismate mutase AroQ [Streptomyces xiaopingdaonensis]
MSASPRRKAVPVPAAALLTATLLVGGAAPADGRRAPAGPETLGPVVEVSADRLAVADRVAAVKWHESAPIGDPERERRVLEEARVKARGAGARPEPVARVFRDHIEAGKEVQHGLHKRWQEGTDRAPARPEGGLASVRREIDRTDQKLVDALAEAATARSAPYCRGRTEGAAARVGEDRRWDALHRDALARAVASVCKV